MSTLHQLYMHVDGICRKHPDAQRWRVTLRGDVIEVFLRPILTSEVTLGALGIGNAPMPVPRLCYEIGMNADQWYFNDHTHQPLHTLTFAQFVAIRQHTTQCINQFYSPQ
jgi:hypothetical protein